MHARVHLKIPPIKSVRQRWMHCSKVCAHTGGILAGIDFITSGQPAQDGHYFAGPLWGDTEGQEKDGQFSYRHLLDGCNDDQLGLFAGDLDDCSSN